MSELFLFSVVFMGSKKYPDENAFDSFIKKHGGNDNAFTDCERVSDHLNINTQSVTAFLFVSRNQLYTRFLIQ